MEQYTDSEYADRFLVLGATGGSPAQTVRLYEEHYRNQRLPNPWTLFAVDQRLRERGSDRWFTTDTGGHDRHSHTRMTRTRKFVTWYKIINLLVHGQLEMMWGCEIHGFGGGYTQTSCSHIYHQKVPGLEPDDYPWQMEFCQWYLQHHAVDPWVTSNVLFTDKTFGRGGTFSTQNIHTQAQANPQSTVRRAHQVRFSINVWAGNIWDDVISPYLLPQQLTWDIYRCFLE